MFVGWVTGVTSSWLLAVCCVWTGVIPNGCMRVLGLFFGKACGCWGACGVAFARWCTCWGLLACWGKLRTVKEGGWWRAVEVSPQAMRSLLVSLLVGISCTPAMGCTRGRYWHASLAHHPCMQVLRSTLARHPCMHRMLVPLEWQAKHAHSRLEYAVWGHAGACGSYFCR